MRLLAIGTSVRHVAQSASEFADVVAVDEFCDVDTERHAERCVRVDEVNEESVAGAARDLDFDAVLTTTPKIPPETPVLGNPVKEMRRVGDKLLFARYCEANGIPHPETSTEPSEGTPLEKPRLAGGGVNNRVVEGSTPAPGMVYQELLEGDVLSVSLLSDGEEAKVVSVNRSLVEVEECRPPNRFAYCGNLTPTDHPLAEEAAEMAGGTVRDLGLKGSVGVDFIAGGDGVVALEVNPRIQASLDTVEVATGLSVTRLHVDSCLGRDPAVEPSFDCYACRLVVYAEEAVEAPNLSGLGCRDVPGPGSTVGEGEPVTSVLRTGGSAEEAVREARRAVARVRATLG